MWQMVEGDCREIIKTILRDECVHAVICDPPYELKFMGRRWDDTGVAYDVEVWKECLRVLRPGGFLFAFGGARTYHRMACAVEDAGFVVLPMIGWLYGQGLPKGGAVSKDDDDIWVGWRYSLAPLKPALEPILMAQKPYEGKALDSIEKHEVGACNIEACRVEGGDKQVKWDQPRGGFWRTDAKVKAERTTNPKGRYPANLVISHGFACGSDGCHPLCAVEVLGEQSGVLKKNAKGEIKISAGKKRDSGWSERKGMYTPGRINVGIRDFGDGGTASRFFNQFDYRPELAEPPFFYCSKAATKERSLGLETKNLHQTIKPIKLMCWLINLVTREGQLILDPFCGVGSTGCAAVLEGRNFIGIELDGEFVQTAEKRITYWEEQADLEKNR